MSDPKPTTAAGKPAAATAPVVKPSATGGKLTRSQAARLAALARWGKYKGKGRPKGGGRARKPKTTAEQRETEKRQAAADNRAKVGDELNAQDAALSKAGLDALTELASGKEPKDAEGLISLGLAERGADGRLRLTSNGKTAYNAAGRGDTVGVLDAVSRANDKVVAGQDKAKAKAEKDKEKAEAAAAEKEKAKGGGGGGGGGKPSDEEKQTEAERKKAQTARLTASKLPPNERLTEAGVGALEAAVNGTLDGAATPVLTRLGLVDADGEATDQGRRALSALQRGNVGQYRAAVQDAQARMEREAARAERDAEREARQAEREQAGAEATAAREARIRADERRRLLRQMGETQKMWTKHGAHDQSSHGRRGPRGRASAGAYRAARAGGASVEEARAAARDVSEVHTARQRMANIDKQLEGGVSDSRRASLQAERQRLQSEVDTRTARTPAARDAGTDVQPTVRGRQGGGAAPRAPEKDLAYWDTPAGLREEQQWNRNQLSTVERNLADARRRGDRAQEQDMLRAREDFNRRITAMDEIIAERSAATPAARQQGAPRNVTRETAEAATQGVRSPRARQQMTEAVAMGELSRNAETGAWQMGPYTGRTAREAFDAAGGRQRRTVAEERAQLERDKDHLITQYARIGQQRSRDSLLTDREARLREREAALDRATKGLDDMDDNPLLLDALDALEDAAALLDSVEPDATKAGRRNSTADQALIDAAYGQACALCDLLEALGAEAEDDEEEDEEEMPESMMDDGAVKMLGEDRVGGYAVRFGSADEPDLSAFRDYFTKSTDFWLDAWQTRPMLYHHAMDAATKDAPVVGRWTDARVDDVGVWLEGQIDMAHRYAAAVKDLVRRGVLKLSSDSAPHLVVRAPGPNNTHEVKRWPLLAASLTPSPAEPRLLPVGALKAAFDAAGLLPPAELIDSPEADDAEAAEVADATKAAADERARRLTLELSLIALETA